MAARFGVRCAAVWLVGIGAALARPAIAQEIEAAQLANLSIEELANIQVTSVSKRPEVVGEAASSIYVLTRADILRTGATSLPEILRLAPNLQVYQTSSSRYVITARGMNGAQTSQNFSNKLLVLIDGRSVYAPLFSGVFWDMQDVLPQDIERIEVISGPGASLWGANAVNGVINITTRSSGDTQGGGASAWAGDQERGTSLRYGGRLSDHLTYRLYARTAFHADTNLVDGSRAQDHWGKTQAGSRLDWTPTESDTLTLQGDVYVGNEGQQGAASQDINGGNVLGRWTRSWENGANLQVQAYYDRAKRGDEVNGVGFHVDTYDLDVQHAFPLGERHQLVLGGGYRINKTRVDNTQTLLFLPANRDLKLVNAFAQDTVSLTADATLTVGLKLEDGPYLSPELSPNARLAWIPRDGVTVWGAVSKAVRSATPFDRDVVERVGGRNFIVGSESFQSEKLTAYELGAKVQISARASASFSTFYNRYDDLRSIELTPVTFLPLYWGNKLGGETWGAEAWGDLQLADWWRVSGSVVYTDQKFRFDPGASRISGPRQVANDPKYQAQLRSLMSVGSAITVTSDLRYVSALPEPRVPSYLELNTRAGWRLSDRVELGLTGRNLLHDDHLEYAEGDRIPRSIYVDVQWRF